MSANKLEECARALICADYAGNGDFDEQKEAWLETLWNSYRRDEYLNRARAVIRCLMDTSEAMMIIGTGEISRADVMLENYDEAVRTYRAMLQSVLDEAQE